MRYKSGPKDKNSDPIEVFKKFFTPNISFIIRSETNRYAHQYISEWNCSHPKSKPKVWIDVTEIEIDSFLGILLASGATHNNTQISSCLWKTTNIPIFRAAMSHKRFLQISRFIRFDDGRTRPFRQASDKAAPIRDIWNYLNENLAKNYEPGAAITVDEQLFPYRGRTKFTQFIPSKPAKYGIKVWWACDAKSKYPLQGILYTGKPIGGEREEKQGEKVLLKLATPYKNSGRTIVADNFFTTLEGAKKLASLGLAYVGTIRANKRCLPPELKKNSARPVLSTIFGFHENLVSVCSYVPKKNKAVNLLSTVHYSTNCQGDAKKPEAILYYNAHKSGVDCMDQMVTHFSSKRPTQRWTYALFCNILDVMALATYCICSELNSGKLKGGRREFLLTLANSLVRPNVEKRANNPFVLSQFGSRLAIESFFGKPIQPPNVHILPKGEEVLQSKKCCYMCLEQTEKLRRKTRFLCCECSKPICQQHSKSKYTCYSCLN